MIHNKNYVGGGYTAMNKKCFLVTGLAIALLCVTSGFCPVYAQGNQAPDISVLRLAQAYNAGKIELTREEIAAIKNEAAIAIAEALENIKKLGISEEDITKHSNVLPQNLSNILVRIISVANLNASAEIKFDALVKIMAGNCQSYLLTWVGLYFGSYVVGLIPIIGPVIAPLVGLARTIFFWATVLCYLGII
jgi:hypothetical protein